MFAAGDIWDARNIVAYVLESSLKGKKMSWVRKGQGLISRVTRQRKRALTQMLAAGEIGERDGMMKIGQDGLYDIVVKL